MEEESLKNFRIAMKTGKAEKSISDMIRKEIEAAGAPVWEPVKKECEERGITGGNFLTKNVEKLSSNDDSYRSLRFAVSRLF